MSLENAPKIPFFYRDAVEKMFEQHGELNYAPPRHPALTGLPETISVIDQPGDVITIGKGYDVAPRPLLEAGGALADLTAHPIPYTCVVQRAYGEPSVYVYVYRRKPGGGESLLSGNTSVGYGGHPDLTEDLRDESSDSHYWTPFENIIAWANVRELQEEFDPNILQQGKYCTDQIIRPGHWFWDQTNPVGKNHLAMLYTYLVPLERQGFVNELGHWVSPHETQEGLNPLLGVLELSSSDIIFRPTAEAAAEGAEYDNVVPKLENWSKVALALLAKQIP